MTYDSKRGKVVLFGGRSWSPTWGTLDLGDTWEWDGIQWVFRGTEGLSPRYASRMVYDEHKGVSVLFGGSGTPTGNPGPYEWDGEKWRDSGWAGAHPANNVSGGSTMVYNSDSHLILFGPTGDINNSPRNFWNWDGTAFSFANLGTAEEGAVVWRSGSSVYDSFKSRVAFFGGRGGNNFKYANNDLRFHDGRAWVVMPDSGATSRFKPADFSKPRSLINRLVSHADPASAHVWSLFSQQHRAVLAGFFPSEEAERAALTESLNSLLPLVSLYDPARFAGLALSSETQQHLGFLPEYTEYTRFNRLLLEDKYPAEILRSPAHPTRRFGHTMVYDSRRRALVLHGGQSTDIYQDPGLVGGQTWEYIAVDRPLINEHPVSQFRKSGETATFGVTYVSPGSPKFQWYHNGTALTDDERITGSLGPILTIRNVRSSDTGGYILDLSNECLSSYSGFAYLTTRPEIQIHDTPGQSTLVWGDPSFQLEQSPTIHGPWVRLLDAKSPFDYSKASGQMFYRLVPIR